MANESCGGDVRSNYGRATPFYYYLWSADGTEKLQRIPAERHRTRSASTSEGGGGEARRAHVDIPSTQGAAAHAHRPPPIDETHTPKTLTIATENMICRFSSTHLSKLQETISAVESDPSQFDFGQMNELSSPSAAGLVGGARQHDSTLGHRASLSERTADDGDCAADDDDDDRASTPEDVKGRDGGGAPHRGGSEKKSTLRESRVLVLYTGGTIGMRCRNGVYAPEQHYLPSAIRELPPLNDVDYVERHYADLKVKPYCLPPVRGVKKRVVYWLVEYEPLLDSSDMTFDDWIRIARDIEKSYNAYDGFVILHGTDTLAYTACALSFMMENLGKPVVLTGAQIPVAEVRSDGRENMIGALIVAGSLDIPEVTVLFNNKLMRGNRVTKMDNSGLDAFHSPNMAPLANMDISINVNYESIFRSSDVEPFHVHGNLCRNVIVLRIFPSMPIESVTASLRPPTLGVVLQTFGSGNMPSRRVDILEEIARAVTRGCLVLNVTQCFKGHVEVSYASGKIVADAGVIAGSDITTEAALAKLAYVLSKDEWDLETKRRMLNRNLRGEMTVMHSEHIDEMDLIPRLAKFLSITSSLETRLLRNALFPPLVCNAAHANDVELLEQLRQNGANVANADYSLRTALHVAASAGSADAVEYLLRHGVSVHARDSSDENALICAVRSKNLRVINAIRKAGGQLVAPLPRIGVELCLAAGHADLQTLRAWREAGADLSTPDYNGRSALHVACHRGLHRVVEFLCTNGAKIGVRDHYGARPTDECARAMAVIEALHPTAATSLAAATAPTTSPDESDGARSDDEADGDASDDVAENSSVRKKFPPTLAPTFTLAGEDAAKISATFTSIGADGAEETVTRLGELEAAATRRKEARRVYRRLRRITDLLKRHESAEREATAETPTDDASGRSGASDDATPKA